MKRSVSVFLQLIAFSVFAPQLALAHGDGAHLMGQVRAITDTTLTVELKDGKEQAITLDAKTKFEGSGVPATVKELHVGDRVVVHARKDGDKLIAQVVKLGKPTKTSPPAHQHDGGTEEEHHHDDHSKH